MKKIVKLKTYLLAAIFLIFLFGTAGSEVPHLINYEGILTDQNGVPVPIGSYDVVFSIYDVPNGGTALWTEPWNTGTTPVITNGGTFSVMLGSINPFPASFFSENPTTYLGIQVGTDSEMLPRQRIVSVAYAIQAGNGIPHGAIIMWSGAVNEIPDGWTLCDGSNGSPDLRDKFILGAGGVLPQSGGTLNHSHLGPSHTHSISGDGAAHTHTYSGNTASSPQQRDASTAGTTNFSDRDHYHAYSGTTSSANANHSHGGTTGAGGAGQTTEGSNLPPYYALSFIMKL